MNFRWIQLKLKVNDKKFYNKNIQLLCLTQKMAFNSEYDDLDEEVKELLLNYKFKKVTLYEPCTIKNFKECLIGINEV